MSPMEPTLPYSFSKCTKEMIGQFMIVNGTAQCLENHWEPKDYKNNTNKPLPGWMLSPARFCRRVLPKMYKARSCSNRFYLMDVCQVQCCVGDLVDTILNLDAPDGMNCRIYDTWHKHTRRGHCMNGRCVTMKWLPPDIKPN
ncbi:uncharacterized protein LOC120847020 [Ixodes scapularis]|uniref:uncharacterized protein LOC120847020 n=1 Tax=Ixodes scapularis TaxID=6945 RepID=UPI001A9FACCC|nr:uncharacterized protein LOC120847020 [Ixodes scapularis]